jgi:hypothetical protein
MPNYVFHNSLRRVENPKVILGALIFLIRKRSINNDGVSKSIDTALRANDRDKIERNQANKG